MSRTFRNRHSVPTGYTVRDGGRIFKQDHPFQRENERRMAYRGHGGDRYWQATRGHFTYEEAYGGAYDIPFRGRLTRKERKEYRKKHYRTYRQKMRDRMRHEEWEEVVPYRRTSGWLTW